MVNSKKIEIYCIIVLHYNAWSNNISELTGLRDLKYIDINMDIVYLQSEWFVRAPV